METYNSQASPKPLFSATVFISVLVSLLTFGALAFGAFFLFNKIKNGQQVSAESNEEVEAQKAMKAQTILASGLTKSKKVVEPIIETIASVEVINTVVEEIDEVIDTVAEEIIVVEEDINDRMVNLIRTKYPHILVVNQEVQREILTSI